MFITSRQLRKIVPGINVERIPVYLPLLNKLESITMDITSIPKGPARPHVPQRGRHTSTRFKERFCCFIAQTAYESASYNCTAELASGAAYEGRKDLGNIIPGDGVRFKGRGLIQVTGRDNYQSCSLALFNDERLLEDPAILEQPEYAMKSAVWFWHKNNLNEICDQPDEWIKIYNRKIYTKFQYLTLKINGGLNGYESRLEFYERAKSVLA